jgi:DNA-binding transcriptional regulator YhcF (GntR family)
VLITRKAVYGLMAMKYVAERGGAGAISSSELAGAYGLPQETLAKVLQHLAEAGLLIAHHGVRGGYTSVPSPPRLASRPLTMVDQTIEKLLNHMTIVDILEHNEDAGVHRESEASPFLAHLLCQR